MSKLIYYPVLLTLALFFAVSSVTADVSMDEANKIAAESLKQFVHQSYHHRIEYDTSFALPVTSKTIHKGPFYLVYFLNGDRFKAEIEVDKGTGAATILALDKMNGPYHDLPGNKFNFRYFNIDSVLVHGFRRTHLEQDSAKLVYFGVNAKLGKRGVVWELFSPAGINYLSLGGGLITLDQIIYGHNTAFEQGGNITADSSRLRFIISEASRLKDLTPDEMTELKLDNQTRQGLIKKYYDEIDSLYKKHPEFRKQIKLPEPDTQSEKK